MSQENRDDGGGRQIKIWAAIMMCVGVVLVFFWPGFGGLLLLMGFFLFVVGRFMD